MGQAKKKFLFEPATDSSTKGNRRSKIRFDADPNTLAYAKPYGNSELKASVGLVIDESHSGCRLAFLENAGLFEGDILLLKVGSLPVMKAEIRWKKSNGSSLCELGLKYLENS